MQRDDVPHSPATGLSTEDLAKPHDTDAEPNAPVYPGEGGEVADATDDTATHSTPTTAANDADATPQLLTDQDQEGLRERWEKIQNAFVDDPREAVQAADSLVANVMQTLATTFDEHKRTLEEQWSHGGQADTEALRTALRHYRSFFNRLLTT
ncbi:hypothetical protein ACFYMX_24915 [Streptomyces griseofuscus]|uniref:hypothetical protein n=1 Tax=Streptomyces TaxID=1883 RepID=UPI00081E71BE|nr:MULTISPECIES: hypothetical protein [unclassified Streptomyces]MYQ93585.1 hypothetical protein [Streptomyces sp. SID4946]SCF82993.1 hypothetical protein GA0115256_122233 [Streptomyces sp. DconLS]SCF92429.1 hypothetical protein GA0115258_1175107 [Streptomyces sp. LamerLS-31b]